MSAEDRLRFGQIALELKLLSPEQLEQALLVLQQQQAEALSPQRIGEILIAAHVLEHRAVQKILFEQQRRRKKSNPSSSLVRAHPRDIGPYELLEVIGSGGMGSVFKAREKSSGRIVALKVLSSRLAADPEFTARFRREVKASGSLNHPNIVHTFDSGEDGGQPYLAMDFIEGQSLGKLLREEIRLPQRRSIEIGLEIARALEHAHSAGIVHRDVKPDNVLLDQEGHACLTDFGLAKLLSEDLFVTQSGIAIGTPHYISPEQVEANRYIDHRADQYSLGATLYHMLTGQVPFDGPTNNDIMLRHLEDPLLDPRQIYSQINPSLVRVLFKLLAKKSSDRYDSTAQLVEDLQQVMNSQEPHYATKSSVSQPMSAISKKSKNGCLALLCVSVYILHCWWVSF